MFVPVFVALNAITELFRDGAIRFALDLVEAAEGDIRTGYGNATAAFGNGKVAVKLGISDRGPSRVCDATVIVGGYIVHTEYGGAHPSVTVLKALKRAREALEAE